MNELVSVGVILLLALLAGHLVKLLRVPEVTGYLLAGVALGPSLLGWISDSNLQALGILSDVALGLILFSIGTIFEIHQFQRIGKQLALVTTCEAFLTGSIVGAALFFAGQPWRVAILLAVMAIETAAASTLMVLRELNASGPVTGFLTGLFALDNLLCLFLFNIAITVIQALAAHSGNSGSLSASVGRLIWQFAGAMALGYIIGFLLSAWSLRVVEHGEQLILLAGCVLLCVGISKWLDVSSLVANLAIGATVVNLSSRGREFVESATGDRSPPQPSVVARLLESLSQTDPPLYAIFFVLAGADLDISKVPSMGVAGLLYILGRTAGKWGGVTLGTRVARATGTQRRWLPTSMLAQAGLAVGLTLTLRNALPDLAAPVSSIVLPAVIIFEMIGPLGARWSVIKCGEFHPDTVASGEVLT